MLRIHNTLVFKAFNGLSQLMVMICGPPVDLVKRMLQLDTNQHIGFCRHRFFNCLPKSYHADTCIVITDPFRLAQTSVSSLPHIRQQEQVVLLATCCCRDYFGKTLNYKLLPLLKLASNKMELPKT